ncbi:MAG TPA: MFS transporter [Gaiellaceae bacterium]|nr:MFS transporter [Gaiellaceae bacterium]
MASQANSDRPGGGSAVALVAMAFAVFVIANDFTALTVALPSIEAEFDSDVGTVQWVINAYALVFGVLIVTGGRLADLFGRKRLFLLGAAVFATFSVLAGAAQDLTWLIACRGLMGIGGALIWPATLGLTYALLPGRAGLAGGLIIGSAGLGNAAGPLLGGVLTDALSWRWVLFVNLPIAALAALAVWRTVPESRGGEEERRIDYLGIATLSLALVSLLLALDLGSEIGWDAWPVIALFVASPALLVAFYRVERRAGEAALLPPDVLANRHFRMVCLSVLLMSPTFFAVLMYLPQYLQKIQGYSPLEAGAALLPLMAVFAVVSFFAGSAYDRIGAKPVVSGGALAICVGLLLLSLVGTGSAYAVLVPGMVLMGVGIGLYYSSVTTAGVTSVDPTRASLAGAIVYMFQVGGGSIGLGLTTAVFSGASSRRLESDAAAEGISADEDDLEAVQGILAGTESAKEVVASFPAQVADRLVALAGDAFVAGMQWAFRVDVLIAFGGFLVALFFVGGPLRGRRPAA